MKINNSIFLIKFISFIFVVIALIPVLDLKIFTLLIISLTIIIFSKIKQNISYLKVLFVFLILILIKIYQGNLYFNEGNNILIFNENSKLFYKEFLPDNVFTFIEKKYEFYDKNSKCNEKDAKCWRSFKPEIISKKGTPFFLNYSPSMNLKNNKYSRKLKDLNINNLKSARISEVNNLRYNYFWGKKFDLVRENMPFFVMIEIPKILIGSKVCWKGNIFWEQNDNNFLNLKNDEYDCEQVSQKDINKKIYGISFGTSETKERLNYLYGTNYIEDDDILDNFLHTNELIFKIEKNPKLLFFDYIVLFLIIVTIIIFFNQIFDFNYKIYLYGIISILIFLFLVFYSEKDLFFGFTIFIGGNDGILYNSYANNIFHHLRQFNIENFLLGSEEIFYFPSSIRYFLAVFKLVFEDTNYGYLLVGYFLCLIILYLFIKIYDFKFGLIFALLIICTRLFEGYGASIIKLLKHINMSDAEPFAITTFLVCLYIFFYIYENRYQKNNLLNFIFGIFSFITISLRPNYLPTVLLLAMIHLFFLLRDNKNQQIFYTLLGLSFTSLITFHNLYFGKQLVFLSSGHIHNTGASLSIYFAAFIDIVNLNFYNSENIERIIIQFNRWIKPEELHYILCFILLLYVFRYKNLYFKIISCLAISQHLVLLIFEPSGRYAYLAWILSIIVSLYILQETLKYITNIGKLRK